MQIVINLLVILDTLILGFGVYMVVTAKPARDRSAKKNTIKGKNPVKTASEFEITPIVKNKQQAKKTSTVRKENSATVKKTSRRLVQ